MQKHYLDIDSKKSWAKNDDLYERALELKQSFSLEWSLFFWNKYKKRPVWQGVFIEIPKL